MTALLALLVGASLTLAACGGGASKSSPATADKSSSAAGTITAGIGYDGDDFDPANTTSALGTSANWHTMEGLTELDPVTRKVFPALAKEMPKKIDDTTWEATLRDGAKYSDGTEVKASDIENSAKLTMEGFYKPMLDFVESVKAKDDKTIEIKTKFPFSLVPERISLIKAFPATQDEASRKSMPIGTGPYKMTSAIKSKAVEFEKNPNYKGPRPAKVEKMHWDILVDDTARVTAITSGTVMAIDKVPAVNKSTLEGKAKTGAVQAFGLDFIMFNTKKPPFDNPKVRQAFLYAIDTNELIKKALGGDGTPATSFLPKGHPNYHKAKMVYTKNVEKAKALLHEAGVSNLDITLNTTDHGNIKAIAPLVQQQLSAIGVNAKISTSASAAMYANVTDVDNPQFDVVLAPGDPSVFGNDPDLLMNWWYGDNSWTQKRTQWGGSKGYTKLHEIMDAALRATGDEQQNKWNEAMDLISEEVPLYPLYHKKVVSAWDESTLDGFMPVGISGVSCVFVAAK
ncbi:MAG: ABC transporter substrate-binding protein [Actinomycetaceae bacterium]|nr:ABC transporter substrate-binding protein [Actinomycetaceae bacterium]